MAAMADTEQPGDVLWLHLNDELPSLGCGRRRVRVLATGWKWMTVREAHKADDTPATRVHRALWDELKRVTPT